MSDLQTREHASQRKIKRDNFIIRIMIEPRFFLANKFKAKMKFISLFVYYFHIVSSCQPSIRLFFNSYSHCNNLKKLCLIILIKKQNFKITVSNQLSN